MKNRSLTDYLPRPAMIVAVIALVAALGGTATAAQKLINGKKIKPGTITSKQIKNRSIGLVDIKPGTVKQLRGAKGERGPTGPQGAPGPAGVVNPVYAEDETETIDQGEEKKLTSLTVPTAGTYIVQAKTNLFALNENMNAECYIGSSNFEIDYARWTAEPAVSQNAISLLGMVDLQAGQEVEFRCLFNGTKGSAWSTRLIAIPVASN